MGLDRLALAVEPEDLAGFTVFKIAMTLMILGAVWGLLTSTRLLRGEEDTGRWELLLAGQTTTPISSSTRRPRPQRRKSSTGDRSSHGPAPG